MLSSSEFKSIELQHKELINNHFKKYPVHHSDYSFSTMMCWHEYMKYYYILIDDSIIIMTKHEDMVQFRPPIGPHTPQLERQVLELAKSEGSEPPFGMIDIDSKNRLENDFPKLIFEPDRDFFDYVYLASDLEQLSGKKYLKIRNMLNRFKKRYDYTVESINSGNIQELKMFLERWCLWKDCDKIPLLLSEKRAVQYCMKHFFELDLSGIVMRIEGNIEATSIFDKLNENTAVVHFEKAIPDFDGIYQAINQETAKILTKDYEFINREADMGFSGLRMAKEKYQPHHMVEIFHVNKEQLDFE